MKSYLTFIAAMLVYGVLTAIPGEWLWFDPGQPVFEDSVAGADPPLRFSRTAKRLTTMTYAILLRRDITDEPACDARGGPFQFLPKRSGVLIGTTLGTWAPSDPRCANLPAGSYYGSVTWTITNPYRDLLPKWLQPALGPLTGLIPPKEIVRQIPVFNMTDEVAE